MEKLKGKMSIINVGRTDKGFIMVEFKELTSRVVFLEAEINYIDFVQAITGLAHVPCDITIRDLELVGKSKEQKTIVFEITSWDKEEIKSLGKQNIPDGWQSDLYFNSQDSVFMDQKTQKKYARMHIYRYLDKEMKCIKR